MAGNGLFCEEHAVVEQHSSDHDHNHCEVNAPNPPIEFLSQTIALTRGGGVHMHFALREVIGRAGVTFAASRDEMVSMNGGVRIAGRKDFMHPVATAAIGGEG